MDNVVIERLNDRSQRTEVRSSANTFYRPELDILRFVAFLMVFLFHLLPNTVGRYSSVHSMVLRDILASIANAMEFGVCLFFVLSAFLITTLLLRERQITSTINLSAFYRRRILRIWPLYLLALLLAFVTCSAVRGFPGYRVIAAYLLMSGNMLSAFHIAADIRPLKIFHLWSISVEEQFYLIFPALTRVASPKSLFAIPSLLVMLAVISLVYLTHGVVNREEIWQNSFVQFMMFAAGIGIALFFYNRPLPRFAFISRIAILIFGLVCCFSAQYLCRIGGDDSSLSTSHAVIGYLLAMLGSSAILLSVLGFSGRLPRLFIYLGKITYGLYVFHIWCISFATFLLGQALHISIGLRTSGIWFVLSKDALALLMTIILAALSYHFLEKPFLRLKKRIETIKTRPI